MVWLDCCSLFESIGLPGLVLPSAWAQSDKVAGGRLSENPSQSLIEALLPREIDTFMRRMSARTTTTATITNWAIRRVKSAEWSGMEQSTHKNVQFNISNGAVN